MNRTRIDLIDLLEGFAVGAFVPAAPFALVAAIYLPIVGGLLVLIFAAAIAYFICLPLFGLLRVLNIVSFPVVAVSATLVTCSPFWLALLFGGAPTGPLLPVWMSLLFAAVLGFTGAVAFWRHVYGAFDARVERGWLYLPDEPRARGRT